MDKELIDHIKDSLIAHEEAYTPGAWERFSVPEEKKRRVVILWPLWSAAALILIFGGLFFFQQGPIVNPQNHNQNSVVRNNEVNTVKKGNTSSAIPPADILKPADDISEGQTAEVRPQLEPMPSGTKNTLHASLNHKNTAVNSPADSKIENKTSISQQEKAAVPVANQPLAVEVKNALTFPKQKAALLAMNPFQAQVNPSPLLTKEYKTLPNSVRDTRIASNQVKKADLVMEKKKIVLPKMTFEEILTRDSYANKETKTAKNKAISKWEPGVFVAPAMGNDNKVNMNYGFSLSYQVADKLSISSGLAYTALSSTSNPNSSSSGSYADAAPNAMTSPNSLASSTGSKSLEYIDASLKGINIPLELKYNLSKKFYTGIGVSALAILNNKQDNNYLVSSARNTTVVNAMGFSEQRMQVVTEKLSEQQAASSTAADRYLGFYNFSLGYKQKISSKKNFAVEPFLRVPMKTFSKDNLNLTNGGLRLKLDF